MRDRALSVPLAFLLGAAATAAPGPQEPTAADLYAEGTRHIETRNWQDAAAAFEAVLERNPGHVASWFNLGTALAALGERPRAIEAYSRTLELAPELFEARMNRSLLLRSETRLGEALEDATRARQLRPDDPVPAMLQASLLEALDRPGEAADAYRRISELDPDNPLAYWRMGSALLAGGQPEEAYQAFLEAERLGMEEVALFVSLGNLEAGRSDLEAAGRHYRRALGLAPEDTEIRLRLGLVLHAAGDPAAAIEVLEPLGGAENVLAEIYFEAGRYEAALAAYRTLVGENPGSTDDWMGLARSAYALDRYGEALDALDEVVTRDPERAAAWGMLGAIHHEAGNYRAAVPALLRRLGLRPDDATSHFMVATAFDNLEDAESALLHYNRFLELDDGSDDARTFQVRRRAELLEKLPR